MDDGVERCLAGISRLPAGLFTRPWDSILATNNQVVTNRDRLIATEIRILASPAVEDQVRAGLKVSGDIPTVSGSDISSTDVVAASATPERTW